MKALNEGFFDTASLSGGGTFDGSSMSGTTLRPKLIGIVKELAPIGGAKTDRELGVGEFQSKYFGNNPVYLDTEKNFYKVLGSRKILQQSLSSWNPFKLWRNFKELMARVKGKGIEGNKVGEGLLQGGLLAINVVLRASASAEVDLAETSGKTDCFFVYVEITGDTIPIASIQVAIHKNPDI